jgi:hypothetical protein
MKTRVSPRTPATSLIEGGVDVTEIDVSDWQFHQATGMVAAQLGVDMATAADRLFEAAAERGEPAEDTVSAVLGRRLRLS